MKTQTERLSVRVPSEQIQFVKALVTSKKYRNQSAVVRAALEALEQNA